MSGASVSNTGAAAIAVDIPRSDAAYAWNQIDVQGSVSAPGQSAITVSSGAPTIDANYTTQQVSMAIGTGGSVTGTTAVALLQSPGNANGRVSVSIDNAGTLIGSGGIALLATAVSTTAGYPDALTTFSTITNRAGASIVGSIVGSVSMLDNAGSIDGGAGSALDTSAFFSPTITNTAGATIASSSAAATIFASPAYTLEVSNAGTIANAGRGAALSGGFVNVTNDAGGQISSAGTTAIIAGTSLNLVNRGNVTGDVIAGDGNSTIDSTQGIINGSVTLGSGNDTLVTRYVGTGTPATGITGAINAGGGINAQRVIFSTDASIATSIDLLPTFQQLILGPSDGVTITLESGFSAPGSLMFVGAGKVVNRAAITLSAPAVFDLDYLYNGLASLQNEGSISASADPGQFGLKFTYHSLVNSDSITVGGTGGGVGMTLSNVDNSGTITASGTGVDLFDGVLTNSGVIISTAGAGVNLSGDVGYTGSNSGTINGAVTGAATSIYLTNSGTISSTGTGVAVQAYGYLINAAGGVVNGGSGGAVTVAFFNAGVANAGTINGNVAFNGFGGNANMSYIALAGGVLNGDLALGDGATLVADLVNTGPGQFAGITGTVSAGSGSALRYAVNADAAATLPAGSFGPFASVGYQLGNNAKLTLTAAAAPARTQTLLLAGSGSVDLDAAISTNDAPAIRTISPITYPGAHITAGGLSITSRGALAVTRTGTGGGYFNAAVVLSAADTFTNAGSITVTDRTSEGVAAISGGASATNVGAITLDGGVGISGTTAVDNSGTITQADGAAAAIGVVGYNTLVNSGTISVGGSAVVIANNFSWDSNTQLTITNTGMLASTAGAAITGGSYGTGMPQIVNQAGGTIAGIDWAIEVSSAMLVNAGTITATVDLGGYGAFGRSSTGAIYVADGGTVAGDVLFGSGTDLLLQRGDALGVSGVIDGGDGIDIYGHSLSSSGTVAIDFSPANIRNFEAALIQAAGANVVVATATGIFDGDLYVAGNGNVVNEATITGSLLASLPYTLTAPYSPDSLFPADHLVSLTNAGSVGGVSGTLASFTNSGTVTSSGQYAPTVTLYGTPTLAFANSGTIESPATQDYYPTVDLLATSAITVVNSGRVDGGMQTRLSARYTEAVARLDVTNSGTIASSNGATAADFYVEAGDSSSSGIIRLVNSGTISARGDTGFGSANALSLYVEGAPTPFAYTVENSGTIDATATTLSGQSPRAAVALTVDSTNLAGTITNAATGVISATGALAYAVLALDSPLNLVNAGTISATGTVTSAAVATFGSAADTVRNTGTIIGDIYLGDGADTVDNGGTITGAVRLGAGDDTYVEGVGSVVTAEIDGGTGTNLYRVALAGDRTGIGARTDFQRLAIDGAGTLALTLDQNYETITLNGTGLALALGGYSVGQIDSTDAAAQLTLDEDLASVRMGAGNDLLTMSIATLAGSYDGGGGVDTFRLTNTGTVTIAGALTGFETLVLPGNALVITGTLGATGETLAVVGGDKSLTLASGGVIAGTVDLGAGNDSFRLAAGGSLTGAVSGGAGANVAVLDLSTAGLTLRGNSLTNFQRLTTEGPGTLTLVGGNFAHDTVTATGDLTVAADASLVAGVTFGPGDHRFAVNGGFVGRVDGGAGNDSIEVSGGKAAVPVQFSGIDNVEAYRMSGGFATVAGTVTLRSVVLTGGRLVGLAGSSLTAPTFTVGQNAIFGSAGTVNGNLAVAGTLSPGASPGVMAVNGNVALAKTSTSIFEITTTVSDKLVVNGAVSIESGATLELVSTGALTAGKSLDLVTATGGITGSYTKIVKPTSLFGFVVQDAGRIRLLGAFLNDAGFSEQAQRTIDYVNGVLTSGQSSAALIAAAPLLVTSSGATDARGFAQISPEPYAAAQQIGSEHGLALADVARGGAFAPSHDTSGIFTFAAALGGTRTLKADATRGTARSRTNGYGFVGGIGIAGTGWSLGAFGGYLDDRQNLAGLGARTKVNGAVAGVHGRARYGGVGIKATVAYDGAKADTRRSLPSGSAAGRYGLHSWTADATADAVVPLSANWELRPSIGGTAIRTRREGVTETGGSAFALTVAARRSTAAFIDGGVTLSGAVATRGTVTARPYLMIGARYQAQGRTPYALAGLGGGAIELSATGAARASVLATATLGADVSLSPRLALFGALIGETGEADHSAAARAGLRLAF